MNTLSSLPRLVEKRKKRLGRGLGSGKGAKSGRGTTRHQKARESVPLHFEGGQGRMVRRFPLLRGKGRNKSLFAKPLIINLETLNAFADNDTVNVKTLIEKGILTSKDSESSVKILGNGVLKKKLTIELPVSQSVKKAVEKLGGEVRL